MHKQTLLLGEQTSQKPEWPYTYLPQKWGAAPALCPLPVGGSFPVLVLETLHEITQRLHAFNRHAIVQRGPATSDGFMAGQLVELHLFGFFHELLLKLLVASHDREGDVHTGADALLHGGYVEAVRAIDDVVDHYALLV